MEERKQTLEKIEMARDALTMQLRNLEQTLQEKDIQVEVSFFDDCRISSSKIKYVKRRQIVSNSYHYVLYSRILSPS